MVLGFDGPEPLNPKPQGSEDSNGKSMRRAQLLGINRINPADPKSPKNPKKVCSV